MKNQFRSPWDMLLISMTVVISVLLIAVAFFTDSLLTYIISISLITIGIFFGVYGYSLHERNYESFGLAGQKTFPTQKFRTLNLVPTP